MPWKARLLTSGLKPSSRLPPLEGGVTQWEIVAGYSGATASDSHGLPFAFHRICYRPVSRCTLRAADGRTTKQKSLQTAAKGDWRLSDKIQKTPTPSSAEGC